MDRIKASLAGEDVVPVGKIKLFALAFFTSKHKITPSLFLARHHQNRTANPC